MELNKINIESRGKYNPLSRLVMVLSYLFFWCVLCILVMCCLMPCFLNWRLHVGHITSFVSIFPLYSLFAGRGLLCLFLFCTSKLYSTVVASFLLGFVYLSLQPSLFILSTIWRDEFSQALVFAFVILIWEFLVLCFGCGSSFQDCVIGCVGFLRIRSTVLVQLLYMYMSMCRMLYF